jgi:hypothetical protein
MEPDALTDKEKLWDELFASPESQALLEKLAAQALSEDSAGKTIPLDELLEPSEESNALCE